MADAVETVTLGRKVVVEAIAQLDAAGEVANQLVGDDSDLADLFWRAAQDLREAAFGRVTGRNGTATDEEYKTDPLIVELEIRSSELAADALEQHFIPDAVHMLRCQARLIRERETIDVDVPQPGRYWPAHS